MGQANHVDAVISIHWNGGSTTASGTETYYAQTRPQDKPFAQTIQANVVDRMGTNDRGVLDDTKSAVGSLGILRYHSGEAYPRALVEIEFITTQQQWRNWIIRYMRLRLILLQEFYSQCENGLLNK